MSITLSEAQRIMDAAIAKAEDLNIKITVSVVDNGGRTIAVNRMDGAIWASTYGSLGKAVGASAFGRPSGVMQARANEPTPSGVAQASGGHMILGQGAVPIIRDGNIEGACGVGGGTSEQDEECATAGVATI
ncbi:MAG: heme-binding protein [SAR202 cluster bacterium]|jgi:glc operon protein GlcG|nr:MAG: heme-binding protein [SAR202 cluster bacterium]MCH2526935.1 heme-binding protein [Dehalococcoidia bacterium]